jgi:hypothetical protein
MISSIVLTDMHNVGINNKNKFQVDTNLMDIKDVPFVRYRFNSFGTKEINYIKLMQAKFPMSIHMVEVMLGEDTGDVLNNIDDSLDGSVVAYVYIPVTDNEVDNGLSQEIINNLNKIKGCSYDRLMLKDKSKTLNYVVANSLRSAASKITDDDEQEIGICSSPLSFNNDACLTAVRARELAAAYAKVENVPIPSANHQCMNCCGCIKYMVIDKDLPMPIIETKAGKGNKLGAPKSTSAPKAKKPKGIPVCRHI